MNRRSFITVFGGAAVAWPLAARAQQAMPVVGYLHPAWAVPPNLLTILRKTLSEAGYVEGRSLADRVPLSPRDNTIGCQLLAAEAGAPSRSRDHRHSPPPAALAAKAATATIPLVFTSDRRSGQARARRQPCHGRAAT